MNILAIQFDGAHFAVCGVLMLIGFLCGAIYGWMLRGERDYPNEDEP